MQTLTKCKVPPEAPEPPVSRSQNLSLAGYYNNPHPEAVYFINSSRTLTLESADMAAYLISKVSLNMTTMTMPIHTVNTPDMNMNAMKRKADPDDPDVFLEQDGNQNKRPRNFHTGYSFSSSSSDDRPDGNGFIATRK